MLAEDPDFNGVTRKVGSMHYAVGRNRETDFHVNPTWGGT